MNPPRVYIGYDERERDAFEVACDSLRRHARGPVCITPIHRVRNEAWGLLSRPWRICRGSLWDVISEAPQSTEFAISRFLTPLLAQTGWALFMDCDVVVLGDIYELFEEADPRYAVMCVKHDFWPQTEIKMDGQLQTAYARKCWSSVMLWNCDHEANRALTLDQLARRPGRDLHRFFWLQDEELGPLSDEWNWLVGQKPKPETPKIAHFTAGGPWFSDWKGAEHDEIWLEARRQATG